MVVLQVFFYAIFLHITSAERCACATGNVHMRDGAGVTHNVVGTMTPGECVSYKGDKIPVGSMQWAHVEYNGNDAYVAVSWLKFQDCTIPHVSSQCACATGSVHVRSGAGTSHGVIGTLTPNTCYAFKGKTTHVGGLNWANIDYNGKDGWVADSWLAIGSCAGNHGTTSTSIQQLPGCPHIVSRAEWGARAPKVHIGNLPATPQNVYIHHGASTSCHDESTCKSIMRSYQNYHMDGHGWDDIGYTFVIGEDGNVYESRGWDKIGTHTLNHNYDGLGFCVIGDFTDHIPNADALNALKQLIKCGVDNGKIRTDYVIYGHRDVRQTACPGQKFYDLIQTWPHYKSPH
ncbi:N-acetylmuramoyl-L-alanine amidase-like [Haliotis rufescens]|uniref:N-acetylmuramoyl-L-alanine amidase-like n=1 Tax=Haliotis rufescens TaxID=6454 RepID=UPI001EB0091D|nr:N-acetylmuramoyl-L-alanine amidase-like [Haliotis rufescens]